MKDEKDEFDTADPRALAELFAAEFESGDVWSEDEIPALFQHQMQAKIVFDCGTDLSDSTEQPAESSFADALLGPQPSLEHIKQIKHFAKQNGQQLRSDVARQVSAVIYLTAISAALVRFGERITQASDNELLKRLRWASNRSWIDDRVRALLDDARDRL